MKPSRNTWTGQYSARSFSVPDIPRSTMKYEVRDKLLWSILYENLQTMGTSMMKIDNYARKLFYMENGRI